MTKKMLAAGAAELAASLGGKLVTDKKQPAVKPPKKEQSVKTKPAKKTAKPEKVTAPTPAPATVPAPTPEKPVATPIIPAPAPVIVPVKKVLSLVESILAAGADGASAMESVNMAKAVLTDSRTVDTFMQAIETADGLADVKLEFEAHPGSRTEWLNKTLTQLKGYVTAWANNGDGAAKKVLAMLNAFAQSEVDVISPLWRLANDVVRPALMVEHYGDLTKLLERLTKLGLVEPKHDQKLTQEGIMLLGKQRHNTVYFPKPQIKPVWDWVKKAEAKAKQRSQELEGDVDALMDEATAEFWPQNVEDGNEGKICLKIGPRRGALLEIVQTQVGPKVKFLVLIGLGRTPSKLIGYDAAADAWPSGGLFQAFKAWKLRRRQAEE